MTLPLVLKSLIKMEVIVGIYIVKECSSCLKIELKKYVPMSAT